MIEAPSLQQVGTSGEGVLQIDHRGSSRHEKLHFPVLKLENVKKQREEHHELLQTLFPNPVRLQRLIQDIEKSFAKEFASIIGSIDFAEQRLAGLLSALKELAEKIEVGETVSPEEVRVHIAEDPRIHQSFEELVHECALQSML